MSAEQQVAVGSTVVVCLNDQVRTVTITAGSTDLTTGAISRHSPLAQALIGRYESEEVQVRTPKDQKTCRIIKVT